MCSIDYSDCRRRSVPSTSSFGEIALYALSSRLLASRELQRETSVYECKQKPMAFSYNGLAVMGRHERGVDEGQKSDGGYHTERN